MLAEKRFERVGLLLYLGAGLLLLLAVPVMNMYWLHLVITAMLFITLATSWNIALMTGQLSLGHAGLFAAGAYASGLLFLHLKVPLVVGMFLGAIPGAILGALMSALCLRMPRWTLGIATLAIAELVRMILTNLSDITMGSIGITVPPLFGGNRVAAAYVAVGIGAVSVLAAYLVRRSRLRFIFGAIHDDEVAARAMGVAVGRYKVLAFALSGCLAGLIGGFYTPYITYIDPETVATVQVSLETKIMPIVGGMLTITGPVVGAVLLSILSEVLRVHLVEAHQLVYGCVLLGVMLFMPRGLVGLAVAAWQRYSRRADAVEAKAQQAWQSRDSPGGRGRAGPP